MTQSLKKYKKWLKNLRVKTMINNMSSADKSTKQKKRALF